jgi:hypothetical protein
VSDIKLQLSGWKAIAVIGIVMAVAGYRFIAVRTTLGTGGADELKMWVLADYVRQGLPALEQALESGDMQAAETQAQQLIASERIQFTEMKARHGAMEGRKMVMECDLARMYISNTEIEGVKDVETATDDNAPRGGGKTKILSQAAVKGKT